VNPWRDITARARQPKKKRKRRPLFTCGACGKSHNSPLGHVCTGGGDFRRRTRQQERAAATARRREAAAAGRKATREKVSAARHQERHKARERLAAALAAERAKTGTRSGAGGARRPAHDYRGCRDRDCERPACIAWNDGLTEGREAGFAEGFAVGAASATEG
jgi:hypothetical protein